MPPSRPGGVSKVKPYDWGQECVGGGTGDHPSVLYGPQSQALRSGSILPATRPDHDDLPRKAHYRTGGYAGANI